MKHRPGWRSRARSLAAATLQAVLAACSPALDWREARPAGSELTMLFPCRPDSDERVVAVAGEPMPMHIHVCRAAGLTFSILFGAIADPAKVTDSLLALRAAAVANIAGAAAVQPWQQPGATPNAQSARLRIEGRLPGGRVVVEHVAFFVSGLTLYQATVLGDTVSQETADTFFGAIRLAP